MRYLGLRLDHLGLHLLCVRLHLLLTRDRHCTALLRLCLRDALVCLRLIGLKLRADVASDIDIRNVDGENLEGCSGIEPLTEYGLRDIIGVRKHILMILRGTDCRDNALTDTRNDRRLSCAADEAIDIRTHRDTGLDLELDPVRRDSGDNRRLDDLRVDAHLHGIQHIAPRKVNRRRALKRQCNLCTV